MVGRISAQIDSAFNEFHGNRWGMFGFLEFDDDPAILGGLLEAAEGWLRLRGCDRMVGPMDFSINDESGVLIEGHDLEPLVKQPWHPPYYQQRCEDAGLLKAMDLLSWRVDGDDRRTMDPALPRVAERARVKHGIVIRPMSRRRLRKELDAFAEVYNDAWSGNWGFVPYSKKDLDGYALDLQFVWSPGWFLVAEHRQEIVGVAMTVLDINQVYKRMKGRLLPLGWWHLATRHRYVDQFQVRVPRGENQVPIHRSGRSPVPGRFRQHHPLPPLWRGSRVDPRNQPFNEPDHGGHRGRRGQAVPPLRAALRGRMSPT